MTSFLSIRNKTNSDLLNKCNNGTDASTPFPSDNSVPLKGLDAGFNAPPCDQAGQYRKRLHPILPSPITNLSQKQIEPLNEKVKKRNPAKKARLDHVVGRAISSTPVTVRFSTPSAPPPAAGTTRLNPSPKQHTSGDAFKHYSLD